MTTPEDECDPFSERPVGSDFVSEYLEENDIDDVFSVKPQDIDPFPDRETNAVFGGSFDIEVGDTVRRKGGSSEDGIATVHGIDYVKGVFQPDSRDLVQVKYGASSSCETSRANLILCQKGRNVQPRIGSGRTQLRISLAES
jgi:hypothetical protein